MIQKEVDTKCFSEEAKALAKKFDESTYPDKQKLLKILNNIIDIIEDL